MPPRGLLRYRRRLAALLAAAAGLALTLAALANVADAQAGGPNASRLRADVVTASQDALRTGWDPTETAMTPAEVKKRP